MSSICRPYIIAEIGFNHEGDMRAAEKMIKAAALAGADAVKFQTFRARDIALPSAPHFNAIRCGEMDMEKHKQLFRTARMHKVDFLSTPYSLWAVDLLEKLGVKAYKIASMDLNNIELLKHVAKTRKPVFVSTGMASLSEIAFTVKQLRSYKCGPITMLHGISLYPVEPKDINMAFMSSIAKTCKCRVGYSDHSIGTRACLVAAIMGASVIEKHFTLDASKPGADHYHSADPAGLKKLVEDIDNALSIIGSAEAISKRADMRNAGIFRRGVYARVDIPKGSVIGREELICVRPVSAFGPDSQGKIIGARARVFIKANSPITGKNIYVKKRR